MFVFSFYQAGKKNGYFTFNKKFPDAEVDFLPGFADENVIDEGGYGIVCNGYGIFH